LRFIRQSVSIEGQQASQGVRTRQVVQHFMDSLSAPLVRGVPHRLRIISAAGAFQHARRV
jgi:hypothetical protein